MAGHRIDMTVDGAELLNKGVVFHAHKTENESSEVIGRLLVSKGRGEVASEKPQRQRYRIELVEIC